MSKYHINPKTGSSGICNPEKTGICKFGEDQKHFGTKKEAQIYYEEVTQSNIEYFDKITTNFTSAEYDETIDHIVKLVDGLVLEDDECLLISGQSKEVLDSLRVDGSVDGDNSNHQWGDVYIDQAYKSIAEQNDSKGFFFTFKIDKKNAYDLVEDYFDVYFSSDVDAEIVLMKKKKTDVISTSYHHEWSEAISAYNEDYTVSDLSETDINSETGDGLDLQVIIEDIKKDDLLSVIRNH